MKSGILGEDEHHGGPHSAGSNSVISRVVLTIPNLNFDDFFPYFKFEQAVGSSRDLSIQGEFICFSSGSGRLSVVSKRNT